MKIVVISTSVSGGAGIAARRLHEGFLKSGHDSSFLTLKESEGNTIVSSIDYFAKKNILIRTFWKYLFKLKARKFVKQLAYKLDNFSLFSIPFGEYPLHLHPVIKRADIINIHWVAGFIDFHSFMKKVNKPVVFTLHDTFLFTAGCHYPNACLGYIESCEQCPIVPLKAQHDVSILFDRKKHAYSTNNNITVAGISKWITDCSVSSTLLGKRKHVTIKNGLDADSFNLYERQALRREFNLSLDRFYVLLVGQDLSDPRKGSDFILPLLNHPQLAHISFLIVGGALQTVRNDRVISYGSIAEKDKLNKLYQLADVYVHLAIQDNFPNTVLESLFNGCPVIGFNVGGVKDLIVNHFNGFLVGRTELNELVMEIKALSEKPSGYDRINIAANAKENFSIEKQTESYYSLFKSILD